MEVTEVTFGGAEQSGAALTLSRGAVAALLRWLDIRERYQWTNQRDRLSGRLSEAGIGYIFGTSTRSSSTHEIECARMGSSAGCELCGSARKRSRPHSRVGGETSRVGGGASPCG